MKTFETEKHNIPEGATHYSVGGAGNYFAWYKRADGFKYRWVPSYIECWDAMDDRGDFNDNYVKPIPQTNIETPEEKEALDLIDTTPHQYEMSKFSGEAEWKNGERCVSRTGYEFTFVGLCNYSGFDCILMSDKGVPTFGFTKELSKPETPQQREEREREELADTACENMFGESIQNCRPDVSATVRCMIDAGYRKESN